MGPQGQVVQLAATLRRVPPTLTVGQRVLHRIQPVAIIELFNGFAGGHQAEILSKVAFSKTRMTIPPHTKLHFVVCVHDGGVKDDGPSCVKVDTCIFFPQVSVYEAGFQASSIGLERLQDLGNYLFHKFFVHSLVLWLRLARLSRAL